ncbi:MAG: protein kinase [Proteobacteria bacterium]|nr:protein kinase [Pseudomonadota bacterium]
MLDRYEIVTELGFGGMATVYRARDTQLRREVAVKVLFPHLCRKVDVVARFQREARAAAGLDHPHIVRVYDVGGGPASEAIPTDRPGRDDTSHSGSERPDSAQSPELDPPYIVMELIRGKSLDEIVDAHHRDHGAPIGEVVACMGAVLCSAVAVAHRAGIVHRDIKPSNIMVAEGGRLALTDFGVARVEEDNPSLVTQTGAVIGTPAFMSPEQATGSEFDHRSDIYSIGATLYKLATGSVPFSGPPVRAVAEIASGDGPVPPLRRNPAMGAELARIIERMMATDPDRRYQSATEVAAALREIAAAADLVDIGRTSRQAMRSGVDTERSGGATDHSIDGELAEFFADPGAYTADRKPRIAAVTLTRAHRACDERNAPRAMALADRVLALEPDGPRVAEALALLERLGPARRRVRMWLLAGPAMAAATIAALLLWPHHDKAAVAPDGAPGPADVASTTPTDANGVGPVSRTPTTRPDLARSSGPASEATARPDIRSGKAQQNRRAAAHSIARSGQKSPHNAQRRAGKTSRTDNDHRTGTTGHGRASPLSTTRRTNAPGQATPGRITGEVDEPLDAGRPGGVAGPKQAATDAARARATVTLDIRPWCNVRIDGRDYGRARRDRIISLDPGQHEIACTQGPGRPEWKTSLNLEPGQHVPLRGSVLKPVQLRVSLERGDSLQVDRRRYSNGSSLRLLPGRHRVDLFSGDDRITGAWVSIPAVPACTLRDVPALDCYR